MDLGKLLNQEPGPPPGRSNSIASIDRKDTQRTPSIAPTHSPASSNLTHTSPMTTAMPLHEGPLRSSVTPVKQSPNSLPPSRDQHQPVGMPQLQAPWSNKRAAPSDQSPDSTAKRLKLRKYTERPIWARLARHNPQPRMGMSSNGTDPHATSMISGSNGHRNAVDLIVEADGGIQNGDNLANINWTKPWLNSMPLDLDLIKARQVLGRWEKSMRYSTPYPDILQRLSDWIADTLQRYRADLSGATFEIEAKIGTLISPATGKRLSFPVENIALVDSGTNLRFESELQIRDFISLNKKLNKTLEESIAPGREHISYDRKIERDSFADLSPEGLDRLPVSLQRTQPTGRDLRVRTTVWEKTGQTTARIVKVPLSHRHIWNPNGYDCRISINVEVDFMQAGANVSVPPTIEKPAPPDRRKERLSYTHLNKTYSVDLTTVHISTLEPKYELEVEVDAGVLLRQMDLMLAGSPHVFSDVVSGFWDNTQFLMRSSAA